MNRATRDGIMPSTRIQSLEERRMLTVFGSVWPNERELTISFPSDAVEIGGSQNVINQSLDALALRHEWQELVLRAYQTWAIHADINIGLRNDYNLGFGAPGLISGDPRFGEFRIGAFPQLGLVANSIPFQQSAGTYAGDLILNSSEHFIYDDWSDGLGPDPASMLPDDRDLFSVLLHESGNTLGLDDTLTEWSVMFRQYTVPKGILTAEDIASIESLYGVRSDPYEQIDNGQLQFASSIPTPLGMDPNTDLIRVRGSLVSGGDVDHYKIVPLAGSDSLTIRVRTSGVSLLQSRLEIVDAAGLVIGQSSAASVFDNDHEVTLSAAGSHSELYLRVSSVDPQDVFAVGDYWVEVDYRDAATRASDLRPGAHDSGPDELFTHFDLLDIEAGSNDSLVDAMVPEPLSAADPGRYAIQSSLSSAADVDYIKITAPVEPTGRLLIHLASVGTDAVRAKLRVVDASGQPVGVAARLRSDGTFTVEIAQPQASQDYFLRISVDPNSTVGLGNYVAVAEFEAPHSQMNDLSANDLSPETDKFIRWTAGKTKLFRFDLAATSAAEGQGVRLTIYDAHTREIKAVAVTQAGLNRSVLTWLQQGDYILRFSAITTGTVPAAMVHYDLKADGLSDDQDTDGDDPTNDPDYDPYGYYGGPYVPGYYDDPGSSYYYNYYYG